MQQLSKFPSELIFDIETLVSAAQPKSILVIGSAPPNFLEDYCSHSRLLGHEIKLEQTSDPNNFLANPPQIQHDMGIVLGAVETLNKQTGGQLIGFLRDVQCLQFCLAISFNRQEKNTEWSMVDMLGFGLRRVAQYDVEGQKSELFKYRLKDYKKTPDWLNASNWANPEMWGKYWW